MNAGAYGGFSTPPPDWSTSAHVDGVAAIAAPAQASSVAVAYIIVPTGSIEAGQIQYSAGVVDSSSPMQSKAIGGTVQAG